VPAADVKGKVGPMPLPGGASDPALSGVPSWAPSVQQVADYIPHRTLTKVPVGITGDDDVYELTFDDTTRPSGSACSRLIGDGCAWVASRVSPLHAVSQPTARVIATLVTAATIERGWPHDDSSLQRALDLEKRADIMLASLLVSNMAAWDDSDNNPDTPELPVMPQWSFPPADCRYDSARYW
jgi:hypothetical protein